MAAAWAAFVAVLHWLLCAVGVLLTVVLVLLLIVLFVPSFAKIRYKDDELSIVVGILLLQVHVYPRIYFLWDRYVDETKEEREARLAKKGRKKGKKSKQQETPRKKIAKKDAEKGAMLSFDLIVKALRTAGMLTKLIVSALRVEQIRLQLFVQDSDPAKTAIKYGKFNAWFYGGLAVLDRFLYLDFKELQITPVFHENFEKSAYFSCKVSARLFILVIVLLRVLQLLRTEQELCDLLLKAK